MYKFQNIIAIFGALVCCSCQVSKPDQQAKIELRPIPPRDAVFKKGAYNASDVDKNTNRQIGYGSTVLRPHYPPELMKAGVEGFAKVAMVIDEKGKIDEAQVVAANDERFGDSVKDAFMKSTFSVSTLHGKPVRVWKIATVKFILSEYRSP